MRFADLRQGLVNLRCADEAEGVDGRGVECEGGAFQGQAVKLRDGRGRTDFAKGEQRRVGQAGIGAPLVPVLIGLLFDQGIVIRCGILPRLLKGIRFRRERLFVLAQRLVLRILPAIRLGVAIVIQGVIQGGVFAFMSSVLP